MTPERIIELAKQSVFLIDDELKRFAELIRNDVLEEAAKECENPDRIPNSTFDGMAAHIRSMKT